jgi:cytidine deaminase
MPVSRLRSKRTDVGVTREELIKVARSAAAHAHAPYSRFGVGAALLMTDGTVVTGCNLENASYGLSITSAGLSGDATVTPCGRCRQTLNEAAQLGGRDLVIHCASADGALVETYRLSELLPHAFGPANLGV